MFCPKKGGYASSKFCYYGQDMAHYSHGLSINVCSRTMVLISIGISVIGAQVRSNPFYLICLRHLIRSRAVTNRISSPKRPIFLHTCATCSESPSNKGTMVLSVPKFTTNLYCIQHTENLYLSRCSAYLR